MPIAATFQRTALNQTNTPTVRGQEGPSAPLSTESDLAVVDAKADQALSDAAAASALAATKLSPADIGATVQAYDADLAAIAALAGTNTIYYRSGANTWSAITIGGNLSFSGGTLNATIGTAGGLASDTDTTLSANSDARIATQKAVKAYVDSSVVGLLDLKGSQNCAANPNYPAALKGDAYYVSAAGKIGGGSGKSVDIGDVVVASADNAGGTEAAVGTSWFVLEHNLTGALLASNNLSDLASAATARSNLGATTVGAGLFTLTNPSAITFPRFNADNSVSALTANAVLVAMGATDAGYNLFTVPNPGAIRYPRINALNTVSLLSASGLLSDIGGLATDVSGNTQSIVNAGTFDFNNFSGMVLISDHTGGAVGMYICGGGTATTLGTTGAMGGTLAYNAGINGYRFTNTSGGTRTFVFASIRTRPAA